MSGGPGQKVVELVLRVTGDDAGDDVGEVCLRVDAVELGGFDDRSDGRPVLTAAIGTSEERILAIQRTGTDGAFNDVGVDLDPAVVEKARQTRPARERVADCFGEFALLANQGELLAQPRLEASMIGRVLCWRAARRSSAARPRISLSIL